MPGVSSCRCTSRTRSRLLGRSWTGAGTVPCSVDLPLPLPVHYMNYEAARVVMDMRLHKALQVRGRLRGEEVL